MSNRILIPLANADGFTAGPSFSDLGIEFSPARGRAELQAIRLRENAFRDWLEGLADELHSALTPRGWEVRLVHLDTANYLELLPATPAVAEDAL